MGGGARRRSRGGEGGAAAAAAARKSAENAAANEGERERPARERPAPRDGVGVGGGAYRPSTANANANAPFRDPYRAPRGESRSQPSSPTRSSRANSKATSPLRKAASFAARNEAARGHGHGHGHGARSNPSSPSRSSSSRRRGSGSKSPGPGATPRQRAEHHKVKGNNEFHAKRYEAALAQYSAGLAEKFDDDGFRAILHANRAAALQATRQYVDAVMDCCASNLLDGTYLRALQRRADAYLSMGDWPNAVKDLETLAPHMGSECASKLEEARRKVRKGSSVDHYAVLGVPQSASQAKVKQAYRQLALKHHPDKAPKAELRDAAEGLFKHVAQAYAVLSDASQRARYYSTVMMALFRRTGGRRTATPDSRSRRASDGRRAAGVKKIFRDSKPTRIRYATAPAATRSRAPLSFAVGGDISRGPPHRRRDGGTLSLGYRPSASDRTATSWSRTPSS